MPRQRQPLMSWGLLLLARKLLPGLKHVPPVTLISILAQVALFIGVIHVPWNSHEVCLSGESILYYKYYRRLFLSAIEHANDLHLYYNMVSFMLKGKTLEPRYGSLKYGILLFVFILCTSGMYVVLAKLAVMVYDDDDYMKECAIGFSGVLFALKVLTSFESGAEEQLVYGLSVPSKYAVWVELLLIHILVQQASFMGHLAGILVGILYVNGPLRLIVDKVHSLIKATVFPGRSYTYDHGFASRNYESQSHGSRDYGWSNTFHQEEPFEPDELRRRRMGRFDD